MREIILDVETTGKEVDKNRIIEIGFVEHLNGRQTGVEYQAYFNPGIQVEEEAQKIHGIDDEFLSNKPSFDEKADEILDLIRDARIVAHNAEFDIGFLNKELQLCNREPISQDRVLDTLSLARRVLPHRAQHNLDALCNYFRLDGSLRTKHGALLDAQYLSEIYLRLNQTKTEDLLEMNGSHLSKGQRANRRFKKRPIPVASGITEAEKIAHDEYVRTQLGSKPLWLSED